MQCEIYIDIVNQDPYVVKLAYRENTVCFTGFICCFSIICLLIYAYHVSYPDVRLYKITVAY